MSARFPIARIDISTAVSTAEKPTLHDKVHIPWDGDGDIRVHTKIKAREPAGEAASNVFS